VIKPNLQLLREIYTLKGTGFIHAYINMYILFLYSGIPIFSEKANKLMHVCYSGSVEFGQILFDFFVAHLSGQTYGAFSGLVLQFRVSTSLH